jgi:hypothetical protein
MFKQPYKKISAFIPIRKYATHNGYNSKKTEQSSYSVMLNIAESVPSNSMNSVRSFSTDSQELLSMSALSLIQVNSTDSVSNQFSEFRTRIAYKFSALIFDHITMHVGGGEKQFSNGIPGIESERNYTEFDGIIMNSVQCRFDPIPGIPHRNRFGRW